MFNQFNHRANSVDYNPDNEINRFVSHPATNEQLSDYDFTVTPRSGLNNLNCPTVAHSVLLSEISLGRLMLEQALRRLPQPMHSTIRLRYSCQMVIAENSLYFVPISIHLFWTLYSGRK
jgi:hypothetical protein